ncbi:MAG: transglutaminase family protein [Chitinophagaceae bacterium]
MPIFKIHHITKYQYNQLVKESCNQLKIYPFQHTSQEILFHELQITHQPQIFEFDDYWGNKVGFFNVLHPHQEMIIESKLTIRTTSLETLNISNQSFWNDLHNAKQNNFKLLELSMPDTINNQLLIDEIIEKLQVKNLSISEVVQAASTYVFNHFKYIKGITTVETTIDEIMQHQSGVCQDFAHVLLQILRTMQIPCRYVSGYICPNKNGLRGEGATHAWIEAYIPNFGWAGIDPTNNVWVTNNHVILAVGKNFNDCTPIKGTFKGLAKQKLSVFVSVGYEDGNCFEEINSVVLDTDNTPTVEKFDYTEAQQQQQ